MAGQLGGKVAIITGAGSGMGKASALAFAREGAQVVIGDWSEEGGRETERLIREAGGEAAFVKTDVSKANEVEALVDSAVKTFGRLNCAFNNAGIGCGPTPLADYTEEEWQRVIDVDLKGVWLCMKYEIPAMIKSGGGSIVNTSSVEGLQAMPGVSPYIAAKHGVIGLTKAAAIDYATSGIRVNAICPGTIRTPLVERWISEHPGAEEEWTMVQPMRRMGTPEEIAAAAVWLCSDASSFVTGHPLVVDGGIVAG